MEHPTEYIIEQYVLKAPEIWGREQELSAHLSECESCSRVAEEVRRFYSDAAAHLEEAEQTPADSSRALVSRQGLHRYHAEDMLEMAPPMPSVSFSRHLSTLVRKHPIASTVSTLGIIAAAVLATILFPRSPVDKNPSFISLDFKEGTVSVYNARSQVLFTTPWAVVVPPQGGDLLAETIRREILVTHPQGSAQNVIVTSLNLGKRAWEDQRAAVRFIDGQGDELRTLPAVSGNVAFRGRSYSLIMRPASLVVSAETPSGSTEIVTQYAGARSPHAYQRADMQGNVLGVYWHFGALKLDSIDLDGSGKTHLLFFGVNDIDDYKRPGVPVIAVVDPDSIQGNCESSASQGFGLPVTHAERYYISLPFPDAALIVGKRIGVQSISRVSGNQWVAHVSEGPAEEQTGLGPGYDVLIDSSFQARELKPNDALIDLHWKLFQQGKLKSPISAEYLHSLLGLVRYWDGTCWTDHATRVRHHTSAPSFPAH